MTTEELAGIARLFDEGKLRIGANVVLSLAEATQAHRMLEGLSPRPNGKIVLATLPL
jgi:NADPH:quinone reductase-like Zn-dependent oxidoreductase